MPDNRIKLAWSDLFGGIDQEALRTQNTLKVPNEFYQHLLDYVMERSYLNNLSQSESFASLPARARRITWLRVMRLPIHPNEMKEYDILSRWQGVLSTLHTWGHRLVFLLRREKGETNLYLGTIPLEGGVAASDALDQFRESATSSMPGIDLAPLTSMDELQDLAESLLGYDAAGAVTGIPSFRKNAQFGMLQTLDQLAFGVRDHAGRECDYAVMVIGDPIPDKEISQMISKFRRLGSEIHSDVNQTIVEADAHMQGAGNSLNIGMILNVAAACMGVPNIPGLLQNIMAGMGGVGISSSTQVTFTRSVTRQYLDKFAQYAEELTEKHCERLRKGRNLGFWNTGVYVLGHSNRDITTVMGMLRAIYSGDETYVEPIRTHLLKGGSQALDTIRRFELVPLRTDDGQPGAPIDLNEEWHLFGKRYQYVSTPLNTEELSLATSLPRRDVPGLRFVKTSVRFANNPAPMGGDHITLGKVVDTGVVQSNEYRIDPNALVRHAIVAGSTGSGKSTTCKKIIREVLDRDIPVMVIEPAKDDYVRWAIAYNQRIAADDTLSDAEKARKQFTIYMPGVEQFEGVRTKPLKLHPFQPAAIEGAPVDMLTRCEQFTALLNASLPVADVLPVIIDEAVYRYLYETLGEDLISGEIPQPQNYPKLDGVMQTARRVLAARGYDKKVQDDIGAALETRFAYLTRGNRGKVLNVNRATDYGELFSKPAVINLSRIANARDKALMMSLLTLAIYEYRASAYMHDEKYRALAQQNKLLHLTVIEEAHNVLMKPPADIGGTGNPQQAAADLFSNMLSEIRSYGQGIVMVDQVPTRLVSDAIKNSNYKIVHRLTAPDDCAVMAAGLALREDQKSIIPALGVGSAIICGDLDDAAAWVAIDHTR